RAFPSRLQTFQKIKRPPGGSWFINQSENMNRGKFPILTERYVGVANIKSQIQVSRALRRKTDREAAKTQGSAMSSTKFQYILCCTWRHCVIAVSLPVK